MTSTTSYAQDARMQTVEEQNITKDASKPPKTTTEAIVTENGVSSTALDWRVSLKIPSEISDSEVFSPFSDTGGKLIFPINPTIIMSQRANYQSITPTHTNYAFHAYQNSQIDDIVITADFFAQNSKDAGYWVASVHFLRTMSKMFYGNSNPQGNPPLVTRLNGYGRYVLNNIPVLITNFTVDMTSDVDYIPCDVAGDGNVTYVPTQSQISVTCTPNYSRRTHSEFDLNKFAKGGYTNGSEGFV